MTLLFAACQGFYLMEDAIRAEVAMGSYRIMDALTPEAFCDRYGDRVHLFARMIASAELEAEDIAQDALIRAIRGLPGFSPRAGGMEAWLWTIVANVSRRHGRLATRRREILERLTRAHQGEIPVPPDVLAVDRLQGAGMMLHVARLPIRSRSAIALRYVADLPFSQVARHLGISEGAAKMAVHRGLQELKRSLESEGNHD